MEKKIQWEHKKIVEEITWQMIEAYTLMQKGDYAIKIHNQEHQNKDVWVEYVHAKFNY